MPTENKNSDQIQLGDIVIWNVGSKDYVFGHAGIVIEIYRDPSYNIQTTSIDVLHAVTFKHVTVSNFQLHDLIEKVRFFSPWHLFEDSTQSYLWNSCQFIQNPLKTISLDIPLLGMPSRSIAGPSVSSDSLPPLELIPGAMPPEPISSEPILSRALPCSDQFLRQKMLIRSQQKYLIEIALEIAQNAQYYRPRIFRAVTGLSYFGKKAKKRLAKYRARRVDESILHHLTCTEFVVLAFQLAFEMHINLFIDLDAKTSLPFNLDRRLVAQGWIKYKISQPESKLHPGEISKKMLLYKQNHSTTSGSACLLLICAELGYFGSITNFSSLNANNKWQEWLQSYGISAHYFQLNFYELLNDYKKNVKEEASPSALRPSGEGTRESKPNSALILHNLELILMESLYMNTDYQKLEMFTSTSGTWPSALVRTAYSLGFHRIRVYCFKIDDLHVLFPGEHEKLLQLLGDQFIVCTPLDFKNVAPQFDSRSIVAFGHHMMVRRPNLNGNIATGGWWMDPLTGTNIPSNQNDLPSYQIHRAILQIDLALGESSPTFRRCTYNQHFGVSCGAAALIHICGELGLYREIVNFPKINKKYWPVSKKLDFYDLLRKHPYDDSICLQLANLEFCLMFLLSRNDRDEILPFYDFVPGVSHKNPEIKEPDPRFWGGGTWPTALIRTAKFLGLKLTGISIFGRISKESPYFNEYQNMLKFQEELGEDFIQVSLTLAVEYKKFIVPPDSRTIVLFGFQHWLVKRPNTRGLNGSWMDPGSGKNIESDPDTGLPVELAGIPPFPTLQINFSL